jgi:CIC family chloride channel protein
MLGGFLARISNQPSAAFVVVGMAAVFGGAARVPIAAMLMVTEMTGGYNLLVAAGLAVMLSYLAQVTLTSPLKYKSLYEQQVPVRADSPAHYVEQLECAINLLQTQQVSVSPSCSHLNLQALLASGIPIDLPDGKQLAIGVLKRKSRYVGKLVMESFPVDGQQEIRVVALFREGHMLLTHAQLTFHEGDRMLVVTTPEAWGRLSKHFVPLSYWMGE